MILIITCKGVGLPRKYLVRVSYSTENPYKGPFQNLMSGPYIPVISDWSVTPPLHASDLLTLKLVCVEYGFDETYVR